VILLHDNAQSHVAKVVKIHYRHFNGKSYYTPRSSNYAPSDYHLFQCNTALLISTSKHMKKIKK